MSAARGSDRGDVPGAARLADVAAGEGALVVVHGVAGTGRTHHLARLERSARSAGLRVAAATASPDEASLAYGVVDDVGRALGAKVAVAEASEQASVAATARRLLDAADAGDDRPGACLVVDDAEWADPCSLRVLVQVARRLRGRAVAVVLATGPNPAHPEATALLDELRALPGAVLVPLAPLTPAQTAELAADAGVAPAAHESVHRRTCGNPFLVTALVDHLSGAAEPDEAVVPDRVRAWVGSRLGRLGPAAVPFARAVATLAADATLSASAALAGLDREQAEDVADALGRVGLLDRGPALAFAQPLVADAVVADIDPFGRARMHRRAAELLVAQHAAPERVARHLLRTEPGGEVWVVDSLRAAAAVATGEGDCATAATLLRRALAEPPGREQRVTVLTELAFAASRAGLPDAA